MRYFLGDGRQVLSYSRIFTGFQCTNLCKCPSSTVIVTETGLADRLPMFSPSSTPHLNHRSSQSTCTYHVTACSPPHAGRIELGVVTRGGRLCWWRRRQFDNRSSSPRSASTAGLAARVAACCTAPCRKCCTTSPSRPGWGVGWGNEFFPYPFCLITLDHRLLW